MNKMTIKGFTLIELLVVISIIALLSSVVLSSLGSARGKAGDSAAKAAMKQMHVQAQNYLDSNGTLGASVAVCTTNVFADSRLAEIRANVLSNAAAGATMSCSTDSTGLKWAVSISALKGTGTAWCTDNQGAFRVGTAAAGICS